MFLLALPFLISSFALATFPPLNGLELRCGNLVQSVPDFLSDSRKITSQRIRGWLKEHEVDIAEIKELLELQTSEELIEAMVAFLKGDAKAIPTELHSMIFGPIQRLNQAIQSSAVLKLNLLRLNELLFPKGKIDLAENRALAIRIALEMMESKANQAHVIELLNQHRFYTELYTADPERFVSHLKALLLIRESNAFDASKMAGLASKAKESVTMNWHNSFMVGNSKVVGILYQKAITEQILEIFKKGCKGKELETLHQLFIDRLKEKKEDFEERDTFDPSEVELGSSFNALRTALKEQIGSGKKAVDVIQDVQGVSISTFYQSVYAKFLKNPFSLIGVPHFYFRAIQRGILLEEINGALEALAQKMPVQTMLNRAKGDYSLRREESGENGEPKWTVFSQLSKKEQLVLKYNHWLERSDRSEFQSENFATVVIQEEGSYRLQISAQIQLEQKGYQFIQKKIGSRGSEEPFYFVKPGTLRSERCIVFAVVEEGSIAYKEVKPDGTILPYIPPTNP